MGGLIGVATPSKSGLISSELYSYVSSYSPSTQSGKFTHLFKIGLYQHVCFYLKFGSVTSTYLSNCSIIDLQNRSASSISVILGNITIFSNELEPNLYVRKNSDNSIDVFVKQIIAEYPTVRLSLIFCSGGWSYSGVVSDVSESELTKVI